MMRRFFTVLLWLGGLLTAGLVRGQQSPNTVKFKVEYDVNTLTYTAYVVPDYNTPNGNNPDNVERGTTAQVTLAVPKDFVISAIGDATGIWDKAPTKLGPGQPNQQVFDALDPNLNYYVIRKAATETNYGTFVAGQSIPLFTFRGNGCFGPIELLPPNSPFISAAAAASSQNVSNSFQSRSGQPAGDNPTFLEQFVGVTGAPADCQPVVTRAVTAAPDNVTTLIGTAVTTPVLTNDAGTGGPVSTTNVSVSITVPPVTGTASLNGDGSITYTPPAGFTGVACYTYQVCELTSTTVCATAQVCVTVLPQPNADVSVTKTVVGDKVRTLGDRITFSVVVRNLSPNAITNLVVKDSLTTGLLFESATASLGTFSQSLLTIPVLAAGASTTLTLTARALTDGISFGYARVVSQDQPDTIAVNNLAQTCVSVPINICTGEGVLATVPATFTDVQWFRDGTLVGTGNSQTFTTAGTYTFTASNSTCPAEGCCPLVIGQTCCPINMCVPFLIARSGPRR